MAGAHYMLAPRDSVSFIPEFPLFSETDYPNVVNSYLLTFLDSHGYQRLLDICSINFSWFLDVSEPKMY